MDEINEAKGELYGNSRGKRIRRRKRKADSNLPVRRSDRVKSRVDESCDKSEKKVVEDTERGIIYEIEI